MVLPLTGRLDGQEAHSAPKEEPKCAVGVRTAAAANEKCSAMQTGAKRQHDKHTLPHQKPKTINPHGLSATLIDCVFDTRGDTYRCMHVVSVYAHWLCGSESIYRQILISKKSGDFSFLFSFSFKLSSSAYIHTCNDDDE